MHHKWERKACLVYIEDFEGRPNLMASQQPQ